MLIDGHACIVQGVLMSEARKPSKVEVPMTDGDWEDLEELRKLSRTPSWAETFRAAVRYHLEALLIREHQRRVVGS